MIKLSEFLETPSMGEVVAERQKKEKESEKRSYAAARVSRLNSDWTTNPSSANYDLRVSLRTLRARARQMARDNSHFKKFLAMCRANVVGAKGIQLQSRALMPDGSLNRKVNKTVEDAFWEWGFKETCTASGKLSWLDAQNLFVTQLARDGEVLVQKIFDKNNPFGFALKFIDVSYLDETYNEELSNGNRVLMSVEIDANDRPQAYYLTTPVSDWMNQGRNRRIRVRVPAGEIIHAFLIFDDETQTRGVTWFHSAMIDAKDLQGYKRGVITSARMAANHVGFFLEKDAEENAFEGEEDDEGREKPIELDMAPLSMNFIPKGYEFQQFDPKQPTQNHAQFYQSILMDLAVGLNVQYFEIAGDMQAVNYSSARVGLNETREMWKGLQEFTADHFCRPVFQEWAKSAFLSGKLNISAKDFREILNPMWRPRGWAYIDPQKEIKANIDALDSNQTTLTEILSDRGVDIVEHFETIANERKLAEKYGIDLSVKKDSAPTAPPENPSEDQP